MGVGDIRSAKDVRLLYNLRTMIKRHLFRYFVYFSLVFVFGLTFVRTPLYGHEDADDKDGDSFYSVELTGTGEKTLSDFLHIKPIQTINLRGVIYGSPEGDLEYTLVCGGNLPSKVGVIKQLAVTPPTTYINGLECEYAVPGYFEPRLNIKVADEEHYDFLPVYYMFDLPAGLNARNVTEVSVNGTRGIPTKNLALFLISAVLAVYAYLIWRIPDKG